MILSSKSYVIQNAEGQNKSATKGVQKASLPDDLYGKFNNVLSTGQPDSAQNKGFISRNGQMFTYTQKRKYISYIYWKREILADHISTKVLNMTLNPIPAVKNTYCILTECNGASLDPCFRSEFCYNDKTFVTIFHAYFYEKSVHHNVDETIILDCENGWEALKIGSQIISDTTWFRMRSRVLFAVLMSAAKSSLRRAPVLKALRDSKNKDIVYNIYQDRYLGTGINCLTFRFIPSEFLGGRNQLGRTWGDVRETLKNEIEPDIQNFGSDDNSL